MADFIKNVLVFTLIVTVMKGMVNSDSFRMYFKFFSGLVLILLMLSPLVNFLSGGSSWYSLLEQEIFNFGMEGINDELGVADGMFGEIVREECKEEIKEQAKKLAENRNMDVKNIDVGLSEKDGSLQVVSVDIELGNDAPVQEDGSIGNIENIEIGEIGNIGASKDAEAASAMSDDGSRKMATGKDALELKEDISNYFVINREAVTIWE